MARLVARLGLTRYEADEFYKMALDAYEKKDLENAILNLGYAIELLPQHAEYYAARGLMYLQDGVHDKAKADFESALKHFEWEMLAHYGLGAIAYYERDWDSAHEHFMNAYRADPNRTETAYYLALTFFRKGDAASAKQLMAQVVARFEATKDKRRTDAQRWLRMLERQ